MSTKPSTPKLSDVARALVYPRSAVTSGWPRIRRRLSDMEVYFDGWQAGVAQLALAQDESGRYASTVGGVTLSIPRQVGKTFTIGALLVALCVEYPGLRVVWTSHHLRTTTNTFRAMQGMVRRRKIAPHLAPNGIRVANGEQEIRFSNGSIIMFGAREHGFGVGIDAIDMLVCDEAQRLTSRALADMMPTTNQARHRHGALVFFIGTPPRPTDQGDEFAARREKALDGRMTNGVYVEMSADPDGDYDDPAQWGKANPSYPHRTPHESMLRLRENLTDPGDWRREAMGVWDPKAEASSRLITVDEWAAVQVTEPPAAADDGVRSFGVAYSLDGSRVAVAGALKHDDGVHLEIIDAMTGPVTEGVEALADWLAERWRTTAVIAITGKAGAGDLADALRRRKVPARLIAVASTNDYFTGCSMLYSSVQGRTITVPKGAATDALELSVAVCDRKQRGAAWGWQATTPDGDETPMEALSIALHGARSSRRKPGRPVKAVTM